MMQDKARRDKEQRIIIRHVDVLIPVHNAAATIVESVESAMNQRICDDDASLTADSISIHVCCYDDGSTDDSWSLLQELDERYKSLRGDDDKSHIPTRLLIEKSFDGASRGAGHARNRAAAMRRVSSAGGRDKDATSFLCLLDSDDTMHPTRVARQLSCMLKRKDPYRTLLGCTFDRLPQDSTWHYATWANTLSEERLWLEQFREVTLLQPTWMMSRSRFEELGGYIGAPPPGDSITVKEFIEQEKRRRSDVLCLIHPTYESVASLRVAEDLRFFHAHLQSGGTLSLYRSDTPLVTYKHRVGQSQSSRTPRKLLLHLRALALETAVLRNDPIWQHHFVVWGAGRDGKDFVKALSPNVRKRVYCFVDVDDKKIDSGYYVNWELGVKIPIVHFSLIAADPVVRKELRRSWEEGQDSNAPGFGRIDKSKPNSESTTTVRERPLKRKRRSLHRVIQGEFDLTLLPKLPVVVCVVMYRTNGALEHNIRRVGRTEGKDLWHFS